MYISNMELIKQKLAFEGQLNISNVIKAILKDSQMNRNKQYMRIAEQYYAGEHDILQHDFRSSVIYEDESCRSGKTIINENNSNHHNIHNFYQTQVDQKVAYIAGKPLSISVEGAVAEDKLKGIAANDLKEYEDYITAVTSDELFTDTITDWLTHASNKGEEWLHCYYDKDGNFCYVIIPAEEIIPFYDTQYQKKLTELIRYYSIAVVKGDKEYLRRKVEWWTSESVTYYVEDEEGNFALEGISPHWNDIVLVDGNVVKREANSWGRIPFIPLYNNSGKTSDLSRIKSLQDAYNLISSASTNNQIDLVELYWIVQGYGGEAAKAIREKLQINKTVQITDPNGKVDAKQVTLSVSERIAWLDMLRSDIFTLGMAIDTTADKFAAAPSGVALQFLYTPLDQKANMMINKLKLALKEFFWFLTEDINNKHGTHFDSSLVKADVNKTIITNDGETIDNIMKSQNLVPDNILLNKHPYVDDVNQAISDMAEQKNQEMERAKKTWLDDDVHVHEEGEE